MKISHIKLLLVACAGLGMTQSCFAQPENIRLAANEIKALDFGMEVKDYFSTLTAAQKTKGKEYAQIAAAYFFKAVLHRGEKAKYPISSEANSLERKCQDVIDKIPDNLFDKVKSKVDVLWGDPHRKSQMLGKLANLDFSQPSLAPQIKKISGLEMKPVIRAADPDMSFIQVSGDHASFASGQHSLKLAEPGKNTPRYLNLNLRAVHCVDETNPEGSSDEMIMSALLIGATGNTRTANGIDCGDFDDGTYRSYGIYNFGRFSMRTTNAYPRAFYAVVQMIEVDSDEKEMIIALNQALYAAGAVVASAWGLGAIVVAVGQAVDLILGFFIDDDAMNIYGIELLLNSVNSLKVNGSSVAMSGGTSANWHTGNITGHGGIYRVGFKCQMSY